MLRILLPLLIGICLVVSCKKDTQEEERITTTCFTNPNNPEFLCTTNDINNHEIVNYDTTLCGIIPLGKNYKWIYRDSVFGTGGQFLRIEMDTLFVEKTVRFPGSQMVFWRMRSKLEKYYFPAQYIYTTDSVLYFLSSSDAFAYNPTRTLYTNKSWLATKYDNPIEQMSGYNGDMHYVQHYLHGLTINVPLGAFNKTSVCEKIWAIPMRIYFNKEAGIVRHEFYQQDWFPYSGHFYTAAGQIPVVNRTYIRRISELVAFIQ
jgi:hypothetical protein